MDALLFAAGLTSVALGAAMAVFAWTIVRQHRRREAARTQLLSGLAFSGGLRTDAPIDHVRLMRTADSPREPSQAQGALFSDPEPSGAASRRTIVLAVIFLIVLVGIGIYRLSGSNENTSAPPAAPPERSAAAATMVAVTQPANAAADVHVELLSLEHTATPTALVVNGRVRNPAGGATLHDVAAVVQVFDSDGRVLKTVRAPIKQTVLNPGDASDFSAAAMKVTNVVRYRVEFHARDRENLPHVDLRQRESKSN